MATQSQYPDNSGYRGERDQFSGNSQFNAISFLVRQLMGELATATVVKVIAVSNAGGITPVGTVDVMPLVNQIDGDGKATPHGIIHDLPYFRLQGGTNAVILDPQVGDIGLAVFASRDISSVKANKAQANPGSRRRFDMADGIYIGGILNGVPAQYVDFSGNGITVVSPTKISVQAPEIDLAGLVVVTGSLTATGGITAGQGTADQVTLQHHIHGTGPVPTPGT